jgi:hypothetical protein
MDCICRVEDRHNNVKVGVGGLSGKSLEFVELIEAQGPWLPTKCMPLSWKAAKKESSNQLG